MTAVGMIGAGSWGSNWIRTLAGLPDVELRWCCDASEAALERVRRQYPQVRTTTRAGDLFDAPAVEAVVIASIAPTHFGLARDALRAGKHVLVEKPMTLTSADALELTALARRQGLVLMVGHLLEYHPAVPYIRDLIDGGELGAVCHLYSQRLNLGTVRSDENAWWSLAPHDVSVACRLLGGRPLTVQCRGQEVLQPGIADIVFATLQFPQGRIAHIHVSWLDPNKTRRLTVVGSRKSVVFDDTLPSHKVMVYGNSFRVNEGGTQPGGVSLFRGDIAIPRLDGTDPLVREARHFLECVRTRAEPISGGEEGAQVVAVLEQGQRSLERGGEVVPITAPVAGKTTWTPARQAAQRTPDPAPVR